MNDKPATTAAAVRPTIKLKGGEHRRVVSGHPWVFSNEVTMETRAKALTPGSLVTVAAPPPRRVGSAATVSSPRGPSSIAVAAPISAADVPGTPIGVRVWPRAFSAPAERSR